jgi:hypothetical protein
MALADFLINFSTAARFLAPKVDTDSQLSEDRDRFQKTLERATIWLTPRAVDGFDPDDFSFLPPSQRAELIRNVERFRQVASQVPRDQPATSHQVSEAIEPFLTILSTVRPYLSRDWLRVDDALNSITPPPEVAGFTHKVGADWTGEDAIWVWATVADEAIPAGRDERLAQSGQLRGLVEEAIRSHGLQGQLYFGVRARSEMPEVIGAYAD